MGSDHANRADTVAFLMLLSTVFLAMVLGLILEDETCLANGFLQRNTPRSLPVQITGGILH